MAEVTGAYAHFPVDPEQCLEVMDEIAREVSEHYTVGYYPTNQARDGQWRKLKVTVAAPPNTKYVIHARSGYYAPVPAPSAQLNSETSGKANNRLGRLLTDPKNQ